MSRLVDQHQGVVLRGGRQREGDVRALEVLRQFGRDVLRLHGWSFIGSAGALAASVAAPEIGRGRIDPLSISPGEPPSSSAATRVVMWAPGEMASV